MATLLQLMQHVRMARGGDRVIFYIGILEKKNLIVPISSFKK